MDLLVFVSSLVALVVTATVLWLTRRWLRRRFPNGDK